MENEAWRKPVARIAVGLLVCLFLMIVIGVSQSEPHPESKESQAIRIGEQTVRSVLRDPDSAEFFEVNARLLGDKTDATQAIVCGYVNARNGFGGFTGRRPFVTMGGHAFLEDQIGEKAFVKLWNKVCAS